MLSRITFVYIGHKDGRAKLGAVHAQDGLLLVRRKDGKDKDDNPIPIPAWTTATKSEVEVLKRIGQRAWRQSDILMGDTMTAEIRALLEADPSIAIASPEQAAKYLREQQSMQEAADALKEASRKAAADTLGWDLGSMAGAAPGAAPASPFEKAAPAAPATFRVATAACPKGKDMSIQAIQGLADQEVEAYVLEGDSWTPIGDSAALKAAGLVIVPASPFEAGKQQDADKDLNARIAAAVAAALADRG